MTPHDELFGIAERLEASAKSAVLEAMQPHFAKLEEVSSTAGRAFSGSWLGYHARVYYKDLEPAPPGAHFSQEWGLRDSYSTLGSVGEWREYDSKQLVDYLRKRAGNPDLGTVAAAAVGAERVFGTAKAEIRSIIQTEDGGGTDSFLASLLQELDNLKPVAPGDLIRHWAPKGQTITRDTTAAGQGTQAPPHLIIKAEVASYRQSFLICAEAAVIARKAASHLQRKSRQRTREARIGTNVFIGHGRASAWRELKDFVQDRLRLPWDEFNRVPVAGVTNQARLAEMLDAAAIALVIMTAEDETAEGAMQARMNVIHEVGLFQGRLGFTKAIVLLEEGCDEFSNIQGLGQIRFPRGNIAAAFEEVRRVLEREGVLADG
ncbi:TIR domain-containing protein [Sphingobium sp. DC-2]|uniref:TIR domain-containing protein n=1 Tax=Sphingobium sp. DC-2 TaxID=1303256 RepID=UPI0004C38240|nr:TIR domain-containing protein [Sphingobium sp. DC-2]